MSDKFVPLSATRLAAWMFGELRQRGSILGVPRELFWTPVRAPYAMERYGVRLETPLGVAAGPHTQLAGNLVLAWLMGCRFLELKTIQTLDEIEVAKPCIDMEDAGFNCEWSQELKIDESFAEYLHAWVLIHALRQELGWGSDPSTPGFLFNMSVGYNLEGILNPNVQSFLDRMDDASAALPEAVEAVADQAPAVRELALPTRLSDNVTLSTMHGCPPDEIERIGLYLIQERGLHTTIKINPTLLGPKRLRRLLNEQLGFRDIQVPDVAFEHDLKYADAVKMIASLRAAAEKKGVFFGLKLTNTLEVMNHRSVFRDDQEMMYMSGRSLHALSLELAATLLEELNAEVPISVSGGVDAFNLGAVLAAGLAPVTVCSDALKPGGYLRLPQYLSRLGDAMAAAGAADLDAWVGTQAETPAAPAAMRVANARARVAAAVASPRHRALAHPVHPKGDAPLEWFDCIAPPCQTGCPAHQNIPDYLYLVAEGRPAEALRVIRDTNPLPRITGAVCDHPCVTRCVRNHYDDPLAIRQVKRFAAYHGRGEAPDTDAPTPAPEHGGQVAVVGAGPAGLAAAFRLRLRGYRVTVFDGRKGPGGMVQWAIPAFRLTEDDIRQDLERIAATGVAFAYGCRIGEDRTFASLREEYDHVIVAVGAQQGRLMGLEGEADTAGVMDGLSFLMDVRAGRSVELGSDVCIVGGGNAAMDAARTAWRLAGDGRVHVLYRRTRAEMPADPDEIAALEDEGVVLDELVMPTRIIARDGRIAGVECVRMALSETDASGRPRPVPIEGSEHEIPCSALVVCVSQRARLGFLEGSEVKLTRWETIEADDATGQTAARAVYAAGDVVTGPSTVIRAVAAGQRVADRILKRDGRAEPQTPLHTPHAVDDLELWRRRATRVERAPLPERPVPSRRDFDEVTPVLDEAAARAEASRCLLCNEMCSLCVSVCPNRANHEYAVDPLEVEVPVLQLHGDALVEQTRRVVSVTQRRQIVNLTHLCNECGNCATFCPTSGAPYRDKPRLHLDRASYEAETERALLYQRSGDTFGLRTRMAGVELRLEQQGDVLRYVTPTAEVLLDTDYEVTRATPGAKAQPGTTVDLRVAVALHLVLQGLQRSLPSLIDG